MTSVVTAGAKMTDEYVRAMGRIAYLWGWPLVNMHNRRLIMAKLPGPGLLGGVVPGASLGSLGMLSDYITPDEKLVACPNQDVVYGFGLLDATLGPSVIQVPEFGARFWVYQAVDQRTDSFVELGAMYGTPPGHYLLAPHDWDGQAPDGILDVLRYDTRLAVCIPRVFMDDTDADRRAIQPLISQVMMYPLAEYTGRMRTFDWRDAPTFPAAGATDGDRETQWVDPARFFDELPAVLDEVPPLPGEQALYGWIRSILSAAAADPRIAELLRETAIDADGGLVRDLFEFRNIGIPSAHHWTTQRNGAAFETDYLSRTSMDKANIFVNKPAETAYYYQDLDADGQRLNGAHAYVVTFPATGLPPVRGFWSLTLYNEHHFFHPNDLNRYSLGTKNKDLVVGDDGSLTIYVGVSPPSDPAHRRNWLPAPDADFSLYLRAYWPDPAILDGTWTPPAVRVASMPRT